MTSSFDWTIKLWSTKLQNEQQLSVSVILLVAVDFFHLLLQYPLQNKTGFPLCSLENNSEYVYDVCWSPVHPAIFASADGEGKLDFWNINVDTEVKMYNIIITNFILLK